MLTPSWFKSTKAWRPSVSVGQKAAAVLSESVTALNKAQAYVYMLSWSSVLWFLPLEKWLWCHRCTAALVSSVHSVQHSFFLMSCSFKTASRKNHSDAFSCQRDAARANSQGNHSALSLFCTLLLHCFTRSLSHCSLHFVQKCSVYMWIILTLWHYFSFRNF